MRRIVVLVRGRRSMVRRGRIRVARIVMVVLVVRMVIRMTAGHSVGMRIL